MSNILQKIIDWFKRLFGKDKPKEPIDPTNPMCRRTIDLRYMKAGKVPNWQKREKECEKIWNYNFEISLDPIEQLQYIQKVINHTRHKIKYVTDQENWGTDDYWPTAKEVTEKSQEDCDGQLSRMQCHCL